MKTWMKYLILGWSIVTVGIIIVSFQLMKQDFVEEDYEIMMVYKEPGKAISEDKLQEWEVIGESLFHGENPFDKYSITKKEFVDRMKKAKGLTIESKSIVKNNSIYLFLPLYVFLIWGIPILVFSLVGVLFSRKNDLT